MSSLTNKYINNRSMNGLINIYADSVETTNSIVNDTLIVDGKDISLTVDQVETNKTNLTGITYTASPTPTTTIVNNIDETGTIYIRDPSDPNVVYMKIAYEPSLYGFCFTDETPGRIMNFRVKNSNGIGYKLFYFASSQLYASMLTYIDNWLTISYNNQIVMGDANSAGVWYGSSQKYIPNTATTSGLVFYNKGLNNNDVYYTNFTHNDPFNVQLYTFRMNYNNIWSLVPHTFNSTLTASGNAIFNGPVTCNSTFNAQTGSFSSNLGVIGDFTCGKINGNGNLTLTGLLNTISGATTFSGATTINNTLTTNNNITQTGTTATTNRIIQSRILNDITGNPNQFKYSEFLYNNSGNGTPQPAIVAKEETSANSMYFFPKLNAGNYNSIVQANDRGIFAFYPIDNNAVTLTCWATTRVGVRCASTSSTATFVDIWAGNYNLKIDSSSGIVASANNWISNNPDFAVLNNIKSRGIRFISQADTGGSNPFVVQTDAVISTQSQNSSLVLTSANSALNFGIRISSSSTTVGSIVSRVASNSITTNQTNTTIAGPVTLTNNLTFSDATVQTTAFNSTALGYTRVGSTFTYPSNTIINCAVGGIGNEIRCHKFNCYNIIEYPDGSIQNTAYTNAKDTKLTAIGTTYTATLTTATLTTGAFYNCGSISLNAGTYILTINATFLVITGSTTIGQILTSYSTSSTGLSANANLNIDNKNGATFAVGVQFILPTTAIVSPTTTTTYYCLVQASFGTASRLQFNNSNSSFSAVKIA
jgi:hypothetical protein